MSLPKLTVPTFYLTIPSTKKKVKFRPFLSNEEKILMLMKKSEDTENILQSMKDIINVCLFKKVDVDSLAIFDIEYIFLELRAKSIGEIIEIDMKCNNEIEIPPPVDDDTPPVDSELKTKPCGGLIPFSINIADIDVNFPEEHTTSIILEDDIGVTLRYPSINDIKMIESNSDNDIDIITNLIESVFDKKNVYPVSETKKEEFDSFIENINSKQIEKIRKKFFYSMPTLEHKTKYKCSKCGYEDEYTFKGINDFF